MTVFGGCRKTGTAGFWAEKTGTVTGRKKHNRLTPNNTVGSEIAADNFIL
jgi:hypothetical protein